MNWVPLSPTPFLSLFFLFFFSFSDCVGLYPSSRGLFPRTKTGLSFFDDEPPPLDLESMLKSTPFFPFTRPLFFFFEASRAPEGRSLVPDPALFERPPLEKISFSYFRDRKARVDLSGSRMIRAPSFALEAPFCIPRGN